mmetsp:Transcript_118812/g.288448  ORF Transcript_118812/g.288448 Transcript_118812/m.288448 type:complete len:278 (+) Transcript_118812:163-996(+)
MLACALEWATPMHHEVIVQQDHVSSLHLHWYGQLHGDLVQLFQFIHLDLFTIVGVVDVGLVDPGCPSGLSEALIPKDLLTLAPQILSVGVHGAPPCRFTGVWVPHDWHLRSSPDLQDLAAIVLRALPEELRFEVDFHLQGLLHHSVGHRFQGTLQGPQVLQEAHGELSSGVLDLPVVDLLQPVRIQPSEHLPAIRDEELAPLLGSLEADEDGRTRRSVANHLVVHAHVELSAGGLVHGLVDAGLLVYSVACSHGMQRVLAGLQVQRVPHLLEADGLL